MARPAGGRCDHIPERSSFMSTMRGIYTTVTDIRRKVFTEVARLSYE